MPCSGPPDRPILPHRYMAGAPPPAAGANNVTAGDFLIWLILSIVTVWDLRSLVAIQPDRNGLPGPHQVRTREVKADGFTPATLA